MNKKIIFITIVAAGVLLLAMAIPYRHIRANMPITALPVSANIKAATEKTATSTTTPDVLLAIGNNKYHISATPDSTVLDAMRTLASSSDFAFTGREYPSLGFFVESINDKKNADGFYWILYINGKSADLGVSQAQIHPGDRIEWRYELGS